MHLTRNVEVLISIGGTEKPSFLRANSPKVFLSALPDFASGFNARLSREAQAKARHTACVLGHASAEQIQRIFDRAINSKIVSSG